MHKLNCWLTVWLVYYLYSVYLVCACILYCIVFFCFRLYILCIVTNLALWLQHTNKDYLLTYIYLSFRHGMLPLVSGINSRLLSVNHALNNISKFRFTQSYEWHFSHCFQRLMTLISHHLSLFHSRLKTFLLSKSSHPCIPFLLQDWLHGFPGFLPVLLNLSVFTF